MTISNGLFKPIFRFFYHRFVLGIKHECDICSEFFASKASLYTHKKSHSQV